jgi:S1-C subfamily serine protease
MKLRHLALAVAITAVFVYYTTSKLGARSGEPWRFALSNAPKSASADSAADRNTSGLGADEVNNIEVYKDASPAVVNITTQAVSYDFFMNAYPVEGAGSGFLIDDEGHIVTNSHVIANARGVKVAVGKDSTRYPAEIIGQDSRSDLAVLKIKVGRKLPFVKLGDSATLQVGQKVLAIGNPFGQFQNTLTTGVISSLGRTIRDEQGQEMEDMIQTDAAINHGNSGGPLLNSHGEVIGINAAIIGQAYLGIGFAIPISHAKQIVTELLKDGRVQRAWLGLETWTIPEDVAEALKFPVRQGALVVRMIENSPADVGGIRGPDRTAFYGFQQLPIGGDLIVAVDDKPITTREDVIRATEHHKVGETMKLTIYRSTRKMDLNIKLESRPVSR